MSLPSPYESPALIAPRFRPLSQRRKRTNRAAGLLWRIEDHARFSRIGIEAQREELRGEGPKVDLSVDEGIGFVLLLERSRLRLAGSAGTGRGPRREPDVDSLIDGRGKGLERNDAGLRAFAVHGAGDASPAATLRDEPERRSQDADRRQPQKRRKRLPLGRGGLDGDGLA